MSSTTVSLRNAQDAFVTQARADENYCNSTRLRMRTSTGANNYSYLYFSRPFPLGAVILSATLTVYGIGALTAKSRTFTASRISTAWKVGYVTYNRKPSVYSADAVTVSSSSAIADGYGWSFNVASHLQTVSDGAPFWGWQLSTDDSSLLYFNSAQASTKKPVLTVVYTLPPSTPTTLSPAGNRAVSSSKPYVRCDFSDPGKNGGMSAIQVQIDAANDFSSPDFDSGEVASTVPELNLASTAYGGCSSGGSTYWRVRVKDGAGLWSGWSDPAQFSYQTKGTLTITNPAASPNNYVNEATPPISWTFSGRTQSAYQVLITDQYATKWLYSSGKITSTSTTHTLPAKIINDGVTYRVYVRVWDTIAREATSGANTWQEAYREFDYHLTAGTPVTSFTGTDLSPLPSVQLDWQRATAPDSWTIVRDGKVVEAGIVAADLFVSGTSYQYIDNGVAPRKSHTWEVRPVVNGVTTSGNPTVTKTLSPSGIWLLDPSTGTGVLLGGNDPGTWSMGEQAEVYTPVGGSKVVRITQALRGFEGSITGILLARSGKTLAQAEADLWDMKEKPGTVYRLVLSDLAIPVVIGNVVIAPSPRAELDKIVSFDFWQVDDLPFEATL